MADVSGVLQGSLKLCEPVSAVSGQRVPSIPEKEEGVRNVLQWFAAWGGKAPKMLRPVCRDGLAVGHQSWNVGNACRLPHCAASTCAVAAEVTHCTHCQVYRVPLEKKETGRRQIKKQMVRLYRQPTGRLHLVSLAGLDGRTVTQSLCACTLMEAVDLVENSPSCTSTKPA